MSVQYVLPVLNLSLPSSEFVGLVKLANEMDRRGFVSIGFQTFARKARLSERTAKLVIREFQNRGWIECVRRGGLNGSDRGRGGRGHVNTYRALWKPKVQGQSDEQCQGNRAANAQLFDETVRTNGDQTGRETVQPLHRDPVRTPVSTRERRAARSSSQPSLAFTYFNLTPTMHQKYLALRAGNHAEVLEMYRQLDAAIGRGEIQPDPDRWRMLDEAYRRMWPPSAAPKRASSFLDDVNAQLQAASGGGR